MADSRAHWDFALRIRGVTPRSVPMSRLAEYLKQFAALLGEGNEPRFAGITQGSARLRSAVPYQHRLETKIRLMAVGGKLIDDAPTESNDSAARAASTIAAMLEDDGVSGEVEERSGEVLLRFPRRVDRETPKEYVVQDVGVIDGVVVGLVGIDDTVHLRLQDSSGQTNKVTLRDLGLARELGKHFRGDMLRVHVHGTWKRTAEGRWEPHALYLDRYEELSDEPANAILSRLSALPGNRWTTMNDPDTLLRSLREDE